MPPTAEAAKRFNQKLREILAAIVAYREPEHEYGFVCECGCGETVRLTRGEYDRGGGAWVEGHMPTEKEGAG